MSLISNPGTAAARAETNHFCTSVQAHLQDYDFMAHTESFSSLLTTETRSIPNYIFPKYAYIIVLHEPLRV
jgi:hypothetical protein